LSRGFAKPFTVTSMSKIAPLLQPGVPERIGKYPVLRELGQGATSRVFHARDAFANRDVAIKVFVPPSTTDANALRRFQRVFLNESSLAGKLNHPHIAGIFDAVTEERYAYLVMEYVAGGTLEQYCHADTLLPLEKAVEVIFKCNRALDYAFQHGVIHRDIKPANILVSQGTDIKLSDFGTALQECNTLTQLSGVGSPAYMSPEQIREEQLTHHTDIYSLGVVIYQLITGRLPFLGTNTASLTYQILNHDPTPVRTLRPDVSETLERIVMRCLEKKREARYRSWIDLAKDLAGAFQALQVGASSITDTEKFNSAKRLDFFRDFDDVQLWEVVRIATWRAVARDAIVLREGDSGDSFFIVGRGEVEVSRAGTYLNTLYTGNCFGEMLYFSESVTQRTTTIRAVTDGMVVEIRAAALSQASQGCQNQFNKAFVRILIDRISQAHAKLASR
jgi:serine/threonine protein kinase